MDSISPNTAISHASALPRPWAKLERDEQGTITGWRSLVDHCLDVAWVVRALLEIPELRLRLARLAGLTDLDPGQRQRLALLSGLHDLGKANHGFQNKGLDKGPRAGHLGELLALIRDPDSAQAQELIQAAELASIAEWFTGGEEALIETLYALCSHHGRPIQPPDDFPAFLWRSSAGYAPTEAVRVCVRALQAAFPIPEGIPSLLPANPLFMHGFLGLLTLADWLGSDERFFPLDPLEAPHPSVGEANREEAVQAALQRTGLPSGQRTTKEAALDAEGFARLFGFRPNTLQEHALSTPLPGTEGSLLALEAETGSGKTEMALTWFLRLYRAGLVGGLYFALPTRAAAVQIHARVQNLLEAVAEEIPSEVILAVPGYTPPEEESSAGIQSENRRYAEQGTEQDRSWASEHPKRYMAGRIVVGTIDQVLLSGLQVRHAHMRAAALLRHLLIVDEVHASDPYMTRILEAVLQRHRTAGGHALLLSATLGEAARARLLAPGTLASWAPFEEAATQPYPALWADTPAPEATPLPLQGKAKEVCVVLQGAMTDAEAVAQIALDAAAAGARVGVLRNTVHEAVATQQALEAAAPDGPLFTCHGVAAPHHSRFAREDRIRLDQALERRLQQEGPLVVAATQTLEQSLDIDFDLLITDLCPVDVLLQRLGRLHRHKRRRPPGHETPRAIVLTPEGELGELLRPTGEARGPAGLGAVYEDLVVLERTREVLAERPTLRIPDDSRTLIERVLHPNCLRQIAESRGGPWLEHWSRMWGVRMGQEGTAELNTADWSRPLSQTRFNEPGEAIRTRLGTDSRRLPLPRATPGVFGSPITEITVPGWMAEGLEEEPAVEAEVHPEGGLVIYADHRAYRYDRFGLRPDKEACRDGEP